MAKELERELHRGRFSACQRQGNLRLSVQLIDPTSEQTLWSEQFDRRVEDILTVQSQLARQVTPGDPGGVDARGTQSHRQAHDRERGGV